MPAIVAAVSNAPSVTQFPVLGVLVRWGANNPKSSISKLLDDSKCWAKKYHCLAPKEKKEYKINEEKYVFFSYLHYGSKHSWHDASQSLRDLEKNNIANTLLKSDVIKNVTQNLKTVKQLATVCKDGLNGLDIIHNELEQQEILSRGCIDESLEQGMVKNIKSSFLGQIASGICYAVNAVKRNFITTPTRQEKSKKVVADLIKLVQKNALKLECGAENEGMELVMEELIAIDGTHKEDITITNAITVLAKEHFTNAKKEKAFSLLTGLKRETNKSQNTYRYKPLTLGNGLGNKEINNKNGDQNKKDWLDMASRDYMLQKSDQEQEGYNASASAKNIEQSWLHQDWCGIQFESKDSEEEHSTKNIIFSLGCSKELAATIRKIITIALPLFIIAHVIPGGFASSCQNINQDASHMINITNASDLSKIGHNAQYPMNGNYQFMNSFDASSHNTFPVLTGHINGNNYTMYNMKSPIVSLLGGNGSIRNINIDSANIAHPLLSSTVAYRMNDYALVCFINIENSFITGIRASASVGGAIGRMENHSQISNIKVTNSLIRASMKSSFAGGVVGVSSDQTVADSIVVSNTLIEALESHSHAGAGIGSIYKNSTLRNFHAVDATVRVFKQYSDAGGVAGIMDNNGIVRNVTVTGTRIETMSFGSWAAAGSGHMKGNANFDTLDAINTTIKTHGISSYAGIGSGEADDNTRICNIMSMKTIIEIDAPGLSAAWGVGYLRSQSQICNVTIIDSMIMIYGLNGTYVGAGVGVIDHSRCNNDSVSNITVLSGIISAIGTEQINICPDHHYGEGVSICAGNTNGENTSICIGNATGEGASIRYIGGYRVYVEYNNKINDDDNKLYRRVYIIKHAIKSAVIVSPWISDCSDPVVHNTASHTTGHDNTSVIIFGACSVALVASTSVGYYLYKKHKNGYDCSSECCAWCKNNDDPDNAMLLDDIN
ncbi:MAG: hypothetical protein QS748_00200 [Candidatus Endonucleobacter bathymodioli]|uniref:Uncharacterized protein n=1 Tax=Candidatus Endonucleibacter bathymodioli TaxID=539814 RepID=A0AA90NNY2_9GAMM|nr:hypothetical protein [Candidatus Endonucleobacter bathymodioli]